MGFTQIDRAQLLAQAHELVTHLESGNFEEAGYILDIFALQQETNLFNEVGRFTRELHDAMRRFTSDTSVLKMAEQDIPDAKQRLNHVIDMTEESAHKTLAAIEECLPRADKLAGKMAETRSRLADGDDQSGAAAAHMLGWMDDAEATLDLIRARLKEIMMAQEVQDLTGQILQKVIHLVQHMEDNLVALLAATGDRFKAGEKTDDGKQTGVHAQGPAVPGVNDADAVSSQDEVDDLLSSLGF